MAACRRSLLRAYPGLEGSVRRGWGAGLAAAANVSAREWSWIRIQRRAPCLAAANRWWVHPPIRPRRTPAVRRCSPSVARTCYPLFGGLVGFSFAPSPSLLFCARRAGGGGGALCGLRTPLVGGPPRGLPFHPVALCLRELLRMRWMRRAGARRPRFPSQGRSADRPQWRPPM